MLQSSVRLQLSDAYKRVTPASEQTESGQRDLINQFLGNYNSKASNPITQFLKDTGIQSFATAATTGFVQGAKAATGEAPGDLSPLLGWLATLPLAEINIEPVGLQAVYEQYHPAEAAA